LTEQAASLAEVFTDDGIDLLEDIQGAQGNVMGVANGRCNDVQSARFFCVCHGFNCSITPCVLRS